jgi:hypothetical protein
MTRAFNARSPTGRSLSPHQHQRARFTAELFLLSRKRGVKCEIPRQGELSGGMAAESNPQKSGQNRLRSDIIKAYPAESWPSG